jgi:hypothetical protein
MPPACFRGEAPWMDSYTPWMGRKGEMGGECGGERQAIEIKYLEDERGGRNARRHSETADGRHAGGAPTRGSTLNLTLTLTLMPSLTLTLVFEIC